MPVLLLAATDELADDGIRMQQIVREQQDGGVVQPAEDGREDAPQLVTLCQQDHPVEFLIAVAVQLEPDDLVPVETGEGDVLRVLEDLRQAGARRVTEDPVAVVEVAIVQLHEAQGDQTVEPGVGHGLHRRAEAVSLDDLKELLPQRHDGAREGLAADEGHVPRLGDRLHPPGLDPEGTGPARDRVDEGVPGGGGEGLELGEVHAGWVQRACFCQSGFRPMAERSICGCFAKWSETRWCHEWPASALASQ